jgi:NAD(P)-dependent dehydrogenase (short-subunit alcohol dehydrogenase family)
MAAQALAANGAKVYITSRRKEVLDKAVASHHPGDSGGEIIACEPCDVRKKADLDKLVKEISAKENHVNLLITAAGINGPKAEPDSEDASNLKAKLWENESPEKWNETYNTDVTAVYFSVVAFLPLLQAGTENHGHLAASVIVISSMSGIMRHAQGHFSYNAAKAATAHLSKMMSAEFQKASIRVNSIAPGYFPSEMTTKGWNTPSLPYPTCTQLTCTEQKAARTRRACCRQKRSSRRAMFRHRGPELTKKWRRQLYVSSESFGHSVVKHG